MNEQALVLVDEKDRPIGQCAPKSQCHLGEGLHHRAFTLLIFNQKGEVLLQQRKHQLWDKIWDLTNSHPVRKENGGEENYEEAIQRCLKREWGVGFSVKKLFGFNYFAQYGHLCENEYCAFFVGEYSGEVFPNSEVAYGYRWLAYLKLIEEINNSSDKFTPWAIQAVQEFSRRYKSLSSF